MKIWELTNKDLDDNFLNEAAEAISIECSDFIKSMKIADQFLYRGIDTTNPLFTAHSPTNRKPLGMLTLLQQALDKILSDTGFTALRNNSICCTPSRSEAGRFGNQHNIGAKTYMIFPKNGYTYHWSELIPDFGENTILQRKLLDICRQFNFKTQNITLDAKKRFINDLQLKNNIGIEQALITQHEVAIHGEYMAISIFYQDFFANFFGLDDYI